MIYFFLLALIMLGSASVSIQSDSLGNLLIDTAGGNATLRSGGRLYDVLQSPRFFGGFVATPRGGAPSIVSTYGDGVALRFVMRDDDAARATYPGDAETRRMSEFPCGLYLGFSDRAFGTMLLRPPVCSFQVVTDAPERRFVVAVVQNTIADLRLWIGVPTVVVLGSAPVMVYTCETGLGVMINCVSQS